MKWMLAILILFILCQTVLANENSLNIDPNYTLAALLASKRSFSISIDDQVTDGCLPFPKRLKDVFEASLRRDNFQIINPTTFGDNIVITAIGGESQKGSCVVYLDANLYQTIFVRVPFTGEIVNDKIVNIRDGILRLPNIIGDRLLVQRKEIMQTKIEQVVSNFADDLYLKIMRARDLIYPDFPNMKKQADDF